MEVVYLEKGILSTEYIVLIITGIVAGTMARVITLVIDYRQNPSYPNGQFINIVTGFVASALGSVAIPAIVEKDFTAITFLALGIQHFRDIRKLERESLGKLEHTEYTKRGEAYIDGIAKTYEARNYISLLTSLTTVFVMKIVGLQNILLNVILGLVVGLISVYIMKWITKGKTVGDICTVRQGNITVEGSELFVDGMFVSSILGTDRSRELMLKEGLAVVIEPKKPIFRITLENYGQRQAMLFEAVRALGVKRYRFTRRNFTQGKVAIALVPIINDIDAMISAVQNTPILENSRKIHRIMKTEPGK
jgi:uncharacterized membrane protein YeaQ/YmgE (transglycosylase-associated protein family)